MRKSSGSNKDPPDRNITSKVTVFMVSVNPHKITIYIQLPSLGLIAATLNTKEDSALYQKRDTVREGRSRSNQSGIKIIEVIVP